MIRLDLSYFYRLGAQIAVIRQFRYDTAMAQYLGPLNQVRPWLQAIQYDPTFGTNMRGAKAKLIPLLQRIDALIARPEESLFTWDDYLGLSGDLNNFEIVLNSDYSMADAYYVQDKKPFSTLALITEGETLFPPDLVYKVPEAIHDLLAAGKCLAFEVGTAAAFHIHRATEAVLRRYWEAVTSNAPKPRTRSIGVYLAAMKRLACGDSKVVAALSQMNELHRNPTIHPEAHLDMSEAIALVGIANSVVAAMLKEIPRDEEAQPKLPLIETRLAE